MRILPFLRSSIFLILAGAAFGQIPIERREPWFGGHSTADIPTQIGGMAFRLKSADLIKSNTVISWVDEVRGRTYTNNTGVNQPTNSWNLGVFFKSGNWLSNNGSILPAWQWQSTQQVFIAYQAVNPANYGSILGSGSAEFLIGYSTAPNNFGDVGGTQNKWVNSYPVSAVNYVIVSVGAAAPVQTYSNAVAALSFTAAGGGFTFDLLGANQAALVDTYQGYIKEIIIWTNVAALTAAQVNLLYVYATNQTYLP